MDCDEGGGGGGSGEGVVLEGEEDEEVMDLVPPRHHNARLAATTTAVWARAWAGAAGAGAGAFHGCRAQGTEGGEAEADLPSFSGDVLAGRAAAVARSVGRTLSGVTASAGTLVTAWGAGAGGYG